jgi:probable HAF family extracellular repeat protein
MISKIINVITLLVGIFCVTNAFAADYTLKFLQTPDGYSSPVARAINASGQVAGNATVSGRSHAFLWDTNGSVRELTMPTGYVSCGVLDMNALGQCVGYATDSAGNDHAFAWDTSGSPRDLSVLNSLYSSAWSINIHGQIVGYSGAASGDNRAIIWDMTGNCTDLGQTNGWSFSRAYGINDSGQIVGENPNGAFLLSGSALSDLGARAGSTDSIALAVNSSGDAIGFVRSPNEANYFWKSTGEVVTMQAFLDSYNTRCLSMNDLSQTVGTCFLPSGSFPFVPTSHAVIWTSTGIISDINPTGMTSSHAYDINNNGWIAGNCSSGTNTYAVIWVPVPEPSCLIALIVGCMGFAFRKRTR